MAIRLYELLNAVTERFGADRVLMVVGAGYGRSIA